MENVLPNLEKESLFMQCYLGKIIYEKIMNLSIGLIDQSQKEKYSKQNTKKKVN